MKKILPTIFGGMLAFFLFLVVSLYPFEKKPIEQTELEPFNFDEYVLPFHHNWMPTKSHPLVASAAIDVDGDGKDEVFLGGSENQPDALIQWQQGELRDISMAWQLGDTSATYGALSIDIDNDADTDLITAGNNGVTIWINDQKKFKPIIVELPLTNDAVPVDLAVADFDNDSDLDIYVSMFVSPEKFRSPVFNDPDHAKSNLLLKNIGNLTFEYVTHKVTAGLQNTFVSSFIDLDLDTHPDLVLAQNTGEIEILRNDGKGNFDRTEFSSGYGFWMGLAVGDYDADGDPDLFFSNIGNSIPEIFLKGDINAEQRLETEWLLLRNNGNFSFTNVTEITGLTGYGFSWGASFADFNLDGILDLSVAQNYVKWPVHKLFKLPGKSFLGKMKDTHSLVNFDQAANPAFGLQPLRVDINGDGRPDTVWVNLNSESVLQVNSEEDDFFAIRLPENLQSAGARIEFNHKDAPSFFNVIGQGLGSDQTSLFTIGVGKNQLNSTSAKIHLRDGKIIHHDKIEKNCVTYSSTGACRN